MAASAIQGSVRYLSDGSTCAWPVPFPFGSPSDLGVVISENGTDRTLSYGKDYLIQNGCIMVVVPAGAAVSIWLKTDQESALAGARAKAAAPIALAAPQAVGIENDDASIEETVTAGLERLQQLANELSVMLTQMLNSEANKLRAQLQSTFTIEQNSATTKIANTAADKSSEINRQATSKINSLYNIEREAIAALDEKNREYNDNITQQVFAIQKFVNQAEDVKDSINTQVHNLRVLSENMENVRSYAAWDLAIAENAAKDAWQAAWQASTMANRPGVGTIGKLSELDKCGSGMFVINGRITHTPTMFFGIWPVDCPCCAAWDGFFVLGPQFPDDPTLPPFPIPDNPHNPINPSNPGNSGSVTGNEIWGPCIHHGDLTGADHA